MALSQDLLSAVDNVLNMIGAAAHDLRAPKVAADSCLYAAYLHSLVLRALTAIGATCNPVSQAALFRFRRNNGYVSDPQGIGWSYVDVHFGGKYYELHTSVYVSTRSQNTELELDVALFSRAACRACRKLQTLPPHRTNRLFLEGKCYTNDVSTTEAKAFIGVWDRIGGSRKFAAIITNATMKDMARDLITGAGLLRFDEVSPLAGVPLQNEQDFVQLLQQQLSVVL